MKISVKSVMYWILGNFEKGMLCKSGLSQKFYPIFDDKPAMIVSEFVGIHISELLTDLALNSIRTGVHVYSFACLQT